MKIGFVNEIPRFKAVDQERELRAAGCTKIYRRQEDKTWEDFLGSLRPSDRPMVTHLQVVAGSRTEVFRAIAAFAARGTLLWVTSRKCFVDGNCIAAVGDMEAYFSGLHRMPTKEVAKHRARLSHYAREQTDIFKGKVKLIERMWKDAKTYKTDAEAVYAVSRLIGRDINKVTLYRRFGGSGRSAGPRGPRKK